MTGGAGSWRLADPAPPRLWSEPGGERRLSGELGARWAAALEDWGAPAAARKSLEAIHDPSTVVVVTGQQPGVWGGPLYCGYKAATAVALARRITRETGRAAIAVFWMGSDDADWDEVAWGTLPRPGLDLFRHRWSASPLGPRRWVGGASLDSPEEALAVLAEWRVTGSADPGELTAPGELATEFARFLHARHGEDGLLVLDARWPELRDSGRELWTRYLERHGKLAAAVEAQGEAMRAANVVPPPRAR